MERDRRIGPDLEKRPCSECGKLCYRICYKGTLLVCPDCFQAHAMKWSTHFGTVQP